MTATNSVPYRSSNIYLKLPILIMFAVLSVASPATMITLLAAGAIQANEWPFAVMILALVFVTLGGCVLSHHRIEITRDSVRLVWFPAYRKTILAAEISAIDQRSINPWHHGLGLRFIGDSTLALMNRGGTGIVVETNTKRRYLIVMKDLDEADLATNLLIDMRNNRPG